MEKTSANAGVGEEEDIDPEHHLHFINAFEMPWWHFSHERQTFERYGCVLSTVRDHIYTNSRAPGRPSIAGTPESRALFLRDRHNIIKQTVLRNENFSPPAFAGRDRTNYLKVSPRPLVCPCLIRLKIDSLRRLKTYSGDQGAGFSCSVCSLDRLKADYASRIWMASYLWTSLKRYSVLNRRESPDLVDSILRALVRVYLPRVRLYWWKVNTRMRKYSL